MTPRDPSADPSYWDAALDHNFEDLAIARDRLIEPEIQGTEAQILPARNYFDKRFKRILLGYSAGAPLQDLAEDYADAYGQTYPDFLAANPPGSAGALVQPSFPRIARILSLAVLCRLRGAAAAGVVRAYDLWDYAGPLAEDQRDLIWEAMAQHLTSDQPRPDTADGVNFPEVYDPLWQAIAPQTEQAARADHLARFLEGWYPQMKAEYEAETADFSANNYVYTGHWCLEAGAGAVLAGIDDAALRSHPHYPKDFVDYARGAKP